MTIIEPFLTSLEAIIFSWRSWGSIKDWLEPKAEPPLQILACPTWWNALYNSKLYYNITLWRTTPYVVENNKYNGQPQETDILSMTDYNKNLE